MKEIRLTQGKVAIVDDDDYEWLNKMSWHLSAYGYAESRKRKSRKNITIYMHALIMNTPPGMKTDHINGNKLDNRRENLRICTLQENNWNRGKRSDNTSGYKGVFWAPVHKKWRACLKINGKPIHLGLFNDLIEAAKAYDDAARKYHGEFARTNF